MPRHRRLSSRVLFAAAVLLAVVVAAFLAPQRSDSVTGQTLPGGGPVPAIAVGLAASPNPSPIGQPITYVLTAVNTGADVLVAVGVQVTLPGTLTGILVDSSACAVPGSSVSCTIGVLLPGAGFVATITATVGPGSGPLLTALATASGVGQISGLPASDTASTTTTVPPALQLTKTVGAPQVRSGDSETYTLVVSNSGTVPVEQVVVDDPLPPQLSNATAADSRCSISGGELLCAAGTLGPGDSAQFLVTATVSAGDGTLIDNQATARGVANGQPVFAMAFALAEAGAPDSGIRVTKIATPAIAAIGSQLTYTITVTNPFSSTLSAVTVTDTLPAGFTGVRTAGDAPCTFNGSTITCRIGKLSQGDTKAIRVIGVITASAGASMTNTAVAKATVNRTGDQVTDSATATTPVKGALRITKLASLDQVAPGQLLTYTLRVDNVGSVDASNLTIADTLPAGFDPGRAPPGCTLTGQALTCTFASLRAGGSLTLPITGTISAPANSTLTNTATVTGTVNGAQVSDSASVQTAVPPAGLVIRKAVDTSPVTSGAPMQYLLKVFNTGNVPITGVTVTDPLPAGFKGTQVFGPNCAIAANTVTCNLGNLGAGQSVQIIVAGRAIAATGTTLTNKATATGTIGAQQVTSSSTAGVLVGSSSTLTISKTPDKTTVPQGDGVVFTITIRNRGSSPATNVVFQDTPPQGAIIPSYGGWGNACGKQNGVLTCTLGTIAPGKSITGTVTMQVFGTLGTVTNTATAGGTIDGQPASSTASAGVEIVSPLKVTKTADKTTVKPGDTITYTITVQEISKDLLGANNVRLDDTLSVGVDLQVQSADLSSCRLNGSTVWCNFGDMQAGDKKTGTLTVKVTAGSGTLTNTVNVQGSISNDANTSDSASVTTTITP